MFVVLWSRHAEMLQVPSYTRESVCTQLQYMFAHTHPTTLYLTRHYFIDILYQLKYPSLYCYMIP